MLSNQSAKKITLTWKEAQLPRVIKAKVSDKWEYSLWQNPPGIGSNHCFWEWDLSEVYLTHEEVTADKKREYIYEGVEYQTALKAKNAAQKHCDKFFEAEG